MDHGPAISGIEPYAYAIGSLLSVASLDHLYRVIGDADPINRRVIVVQNESVGMNVPRPEKLRLTYINFVDV